MNCPEFRRIVGAEPHCATPEVIAHAAQHPACGRYQLEMQQMDKLIHRALEIDVNVPAVKRHRAAWRPMQWGLAASVMIAVLFASLWLAYPRATLAEQVVEHAQGEAAAMIVTSQTVDPTTLENVLAQSEVRMKPGAGPVSYARSCAFRGHNVPHLVVQTRSGPVTVIVLPQEQSITRPETFNEGGYEGVIMPAPRGALAVLGRAAPVKEVAAKVLASIEYVGLASSDW